MKRKLTERQAFEAWFKRYYQVPPAPDSHAAWHVWEAWKASARRKRVSERVITKSLNDHLLYPRKRK